MEVTCLNFQGPNGGTAEEGWEEAGRRGATEGNSSDAVGACEKVLEVEG